MTGAAGESSSEVVECLVDAHVLTVGIEESDTIDPVGHLQEQSVLVGCPVHRHAEVPRLPFRDLDLDWGVERLRTRFDHRRELRAARAAGPHARTVLRWSRPVLAIRRTVVLRIAWPLADLAELTMPGTDQVAEALGRQPRWAAA